LRKEGGRSICPLLSTFTPTVNQTGQKVKNAFFYIWLAINDLWICLDTKKTLGGA
jgi:hypothetical protein